jgi:hypothetical protein
MLLWLQKLLGRQQPASPPPKIHICAGLEIECRPGMPGGCVFCERDVRINHPIRKLLIPYMLVTWRHPGGEPIQCRYLGPAENPEHALCEGWPLHVITRGNNKGEERVQYMYPQWDELELVVKVVTDCAVGGD